MRARQTTRRIQTKTVSGSTIALYDGANVVEERDASGAVVASYTQGLGIDEPMAMQRGGNVEYYQADGLGSITSLTGGTGQLTATYGYDSFGNTTPTEGIFNPYRYTAREQDPETGLYYYRARYYDPEIGRFISEDPISFGGEINFYSYVSNSPLRFIDPWGLCASEKETRRCIFNALVYFFSGIDATVEEATKEGKKGDGVVGGHRNFRVRFRFSSQKQAKKFRDSLNRNWLKALFFSDWGEGKRYGSTVDESLHLKHIDDPVLDRDGGYSVSGTAHIDLGNPNVRFPVGFNNHRKRDLVEGNRTTENIDPANCPW